MVKPGFARTRFALTLVAVAALALSFTAAPRETALDRYVHAVDPTYRFELVKTIETSGATAYVLDLTSQAWKPPIEPDRTVWRHWLTVVRPDRVDHPTGFLFIAGGSNRDKPPEKPDSLVTEIALTTHSVAAELRMVPNQPLDFPDAGKRGLVEDEFIAYTWDKFLRTGDERWPARLPMTKSAVRAMDAVQAFLKSDVGGHVTVDRFMVAGGSKRGWTTWTTAIVDPRVVAIAPMVIDLLNTEKSFEHHYRAYGFYAPAVKDYEQLGIMQWMGSGQFRKLMQIEEPYEYRDRLTLPKFMINAAGDQFFLPDSSQFYFDDLKGEKYLRYVPNADHSLRNSDARESLIAFYDALLRQQPRPTFSWRFDRDGTIRVTSPTRPADVKLWQATNSEQRDFRLLTIGPSYQSTSLQAESDGTYVGKVQKPAHGWTAYFVELTYPTGGKYPLKFTTSVRVTPDTLPFNVPKFSPLAASPSAPILDLRRFNVVVYGGTAGGVITAVSAARSGLKVALLEPQRHLGGMVSGGLGWTDFGKKEVIGGYSLEFFERVGQRYGEPIAWHFEPHVAEEVLKEMAADAGVLVFYQQRLKENTGVRKQGTRITEIQMENGSRYQADVFADATYEGDLMAQAGVSYVYGREGIEQYGESLAGVRDRTPFHQFMIRRDPKDPKSAVPVQISPYDDNYKLLPEIQAGEKGRAGQADKKVQAYNFRLCLTDDPGNLVPIPKPANYDPSRYALLARFLKAAKEIAGRPLILSDVMSPSALERRRKLDVNNNGAFSTDYIGGSWLYPDGDYKTRSRIWQAHIDYIAGFFYFLAHDPQVPSELQQEVNRWGLAKDEFTDTNNWPHQLYVREARRMVGEYVMTQKDIQTDLTKPDPIGMGSYNSDSHNIQRIVNADGFVENEGDMQVPVTPYQIPYRLILPQRKQATNLLVPVAFSASHVAYSTLRMEPQYMIIGQAAGAAAVMAIQKRVPVQDVDPTALTALLLRQRAVMEWKKPQILPQPVPSVTLPLIR